MIITLEDMKDFLGESETSSDAVITDLIESAGRTSNNHRARFSKWSNGKNYQISSKNEQQRRFKKNPDFRRN